MIRRLSGCFHPLKNYVLAQIFHYHFQLGGLPARFGRRFDEKHAAIVLPIALSLPYIVAILATAFSNIKR